MPESKPAEQSAATKPTEKPQARQDQTDPGKGLGDEIAAAHKSRTTVPGRPDVDARLDNRSTEALTERTFGPDDAKPQHVSGPDVAGQAEHTRSILAKQKKG